MNRFLQVDRRTPNDLIYGELGRFPIYLNSYVKCIKYWLKLVHMNENRLPLKAYKTLCELDAKGKRTWVTSVRNCLCNYGFSFVWIEQGVGCIASFLSCFRQRLIDCRWQDWGNHVSNSERFSLFKLLKTNHFIEPYLLMNNMNRFVRRTLTKLRFGISDITIHRQRYNSFSAQTMLCPLCSTAKEDEVHFVFCCPVFDDLRHKYIPLKYYRNPVLFRLALLLSSKNETIIYNLATYLYKSFKRRSIMVS
eukprot:TRINITY_DN25249_c0_g1_i2.p1 TRINITY_DN25249_c0_g1~~TRINITY_DN25249_c0_g1_i2.p1  ORF type:complete len:276 (+),score=3.13 TRINITY_DN25249_c0_g1_i2:81-830(+)